MKYSIRNILSRILSGDSDQKDEKIVNLLEKEFLLDKSDELSKSRIRDNKLQEEIFAKIDSVINKKNRWMWTKIAAAIVLFVSISGTVFYQNNNLIINYSEIQNNSGVNKTYYLADGSSIILKSGSVLKYSDDFNINYRRVELYGEAFFDIERNENKPFIIKTGKLQTEVLGTSFNIKETVNNVLVTVVSGLVKVYDENNLIRIKPNQEVLYNRNKNDLLKSNIKSYYATSWFAEKTRLKKVSIDELGEFLERKYDVKLIYSDKSIANNYLSLTVYKDDSLESVVKKINDLRELKLVINNKEIRVKKIK